MKLDDEVKIKGKSVKIIFLVMAGIIAWGLISWGLGLTTDDVGITQ